MNIGQLSTLGYGLLDLIMAPYFCISWRGGEMLATKSLLWGEVVGWKILQFLISKVIVVVVVVV